MNAVPLITNPVPASLLAGRVRLIPVLPCPETPKAGSMQPASRLAARTGAIHGAGISRGAKQGTSIGLTPEAPA